MQWIIKIVAGLSSGGIVSVIGSVLDLANGLMEMAHNRGLIQQGERNQFAKQTAAILQSAGIARDIERETDAMTPEEINRNLEQNFRD